MQGVLYQKSFSISNLPNSVRALCSAALAGDATSRPRDGEGFSSRNQWRAAVFLPGGGDPGQVKCPDHAVPSNAPPSGSRARHWRRSRLELGFGSLSPGGKGGCRAWPPPEVRCPLPKSLRRGKAVRAPGKREGALQPSSGALLRGARPVRVVGRVSPLARLHRLAQTRLGAPSG